MDVDKKLGLSLDDLIKKTRPAKKVSAPAQKSKKPTGAIAKKNLNKVGKKAQVGYVFPNIFHHITCSVRKSLDKNDRRDKKPVVRKTERMVVDRRGSRDVHTTTVVIRKGPNAPESSRKVKIQNIPYELTWKDIKTALSDVGKIERCDVEHGEALVTFATHKEATRAVQNYDGGDMNGRKIRVSIV